VSLSARIREWREDSVRQRAAKRLRQVSTHEVLTWAETAVNGFHQNLDAYRNRADQAAFEELRKAVSMLRGAVDVLEDRNRS
jgi:uncharacterized protein YlxW (UPF0749 family)